MPENIEPCRSLRSGPEEAGRRKRAGKSQRVRNDDQRTEKISAREHQERPLTHDRELSEQQGGGEEVVDEERGLESRDESGDRRKLGVRKRHREGECDEQGDDDGDSQLALSRCRRQRRQQELGFIGRRLVHWHSKRCSPTRPRYWPTLSRSRRSCGRICSQPSSLSNRTIASSVGSARK